LELAFELKKMVLGLESKNSLPEKITYDYEFTDLKRSYGHLPDPAPPTGDSAETISSGAATDGQCGSHSASSAEPKTLTPSMAPPVEQGCPVVPVSPPAAAPQAVPRRCDCWSRLARQLRRRSARVGGFN